MVVMEGELGPVCYLLTGELRVDCGDVLRARCCRWKYPIGSANAVIDTTSSRTTRDAKIFMLTLVRRVLFL